MTAKERSRPRDANKARMRSQSLSNLLVVSTYCPLERDAVLQVSSPKLRGMSKLKISDSSTERGSGQEVIG